MASGTQLLHRITGQAASTGPLLVPLRELFSSLARTFWEYSVPVEPVRLSPEHCLIVESGQVEHYHLNGDVGWASYGAIRQAFKDRDTRASREGGAKTSVLPSKLVDAEIKLVIRDQDNPIRCAAVWERVYPKRAWVGTLHPALGVPMTFVVAAILNSAIGQVTYSRLARKRGHKSHDLRKALVGELKIPVLAYDEEAFQRAALLSYRLHCLYAASSACSLPADVMDVLVPNHWERLLSELVRLYGYSEPDARKLVEETLPAGLADVPGFQGKLYYVLREPLQEVRLTDAAVIDRYEKLKAAVRNTNASAKDEAELAALRRLLEWEDRINRSIPRSLQPEPWPGVSDEKLALKVAQRYLSDRWGQRYGAEEPQQIDRRQWQVRVFYSPPPALKPEEVRRIPPQWATPGKHLAGYLRIDRVTGAVSESGEHFKNALAF
ncbi:MAG TPA: hypothetical protein VEX38_04850 [Fimbriimonadaceae bacterium]|nr:hypothetical protein [Fimbriimonadaceae bacterium]